MAKTKITKALKEKAKECALSGLTHAQTAIALGISRSTLYTKNYIDILDTIKEAENDLRIDVAQDLRTASNNGEVTAQIFLAKRLNLFSASYKMPQIKSVKTALTQISRINADLASGLIPLELSNSLIKNISEYLKAYELSKLSESVSEIQAQLDEQKKF